MNKLEQKAAAFLDKCSVVSMSSITDDGYPRICAMAKLKSDGFTNIWVSTGTDSKKVKHYLENPKSGVLYYDTNDSVTLLGLVEIVDDMAVKRELWQDWLINHFKGGVCDPGYCVLKFTATEATIYIDGEFETFKY